MKRLTSVIMAGVLSACVSNPMQTQVSRNMVGLWEENWPTVHSITLRKADGSYRAKVVGIYDYAKPPVAYESAGHWHVSGKRYVSSTDYMSESELRREVGKEWGGDILISEEEFLRYLSADGAVVEERRIGEASDGEFEKATLKPLAKAP